MEKVEEPVVVDETVDVKKEEVVKCVEGEANAKKKRKRKKKKGGGNATGNNNSAMEIKGQSFPPTIPVSKLIPDRKNMPIGEIMQHPCDFNTFRFDSAEKKTMDLIYDDMLTDLREAAEVHRQVRYAFQKWVKPGKSMIDIVQFIENGTKALLPSDGLKRGWGFPTGVSLNHVAAHYTPNYKDTTVLGPKDIMKVDYGTQINGHIIDCAWTVSFDPQFDQLKKAVQEATEAGIKAAGIDVRLCDIGEQIQEVMESYEVTIDGKTYPVKSIRNLNGHNISPYRIHAGNSVPIVKNQDTTKMKEGELYAIETFGSTGRGLVVEDMACSHYMRNFDAPQRVNTRSKKAKELINHIDKTYTTLPFCRRWLDDAGMKGYLLGLKELVDNDIINAYPPLCDVKGSYTAQYEHTIFLHPSKKEVISRGVDY